MKKMVSLVLTFVICLSLCACGQNNTQASTTTISGANSKESATNGEKIEFNDLILAEDENIKISLVNFHVEERNTVNGVQEAKCAILKIENKTDYEILFYPKAYLDNEEVIVTFISSNSVEPGRVGRFEAHYTYLDGTVVESLDMLYGLEWSQELRIQTEPYSTRYTLEFSVAEALN